MNRLLAAGLLATSWPGALPADPPPFLKDLLRHDEELRSLPLGDVVFAATGHKVLPFDKTNPVHRELLTGIRKAANETAAALGRPDSDVQKEARINEASLHFEDLLLEKLNAIPGWKCAIPTRPDGAEQRSGYPDLRLVHESSGTVFYLDPKLFKTSSRESTLRTFYFEPNESTNKIHDDAVHLLLGFPHDGEPGAWRFEAPEIVDLSRLTVRLKAEFQASNKDIYLDSAILGEKETKPE